jgi:hypothetical protein
MRRCDNAAALTLEDVLETDSWARTAARELMRLEPLPAQL